MCRSRVASFILTFKKTYVKNLEEEEKGKTKNGIEAVWGWSRTRGPFASLSLRRERELTGEEKQQGITARTFHK